MIAEESAVFILYSLLFFSIRFNKIIPYSRKKVLRVMHLLKKNNIFVI
jgi:hypothetical protein